MVPCHPQFDQQIRAQFETLWQEARSGQLADWEQTPEGALALVILLDQIPLNMYRGQADNFATEAVAREVATRAIASQFDQQLPDKGKAFLYMASTPEEDAWLASQQAFHG